MAVANVESHGRRHVNPFVEQQLERASGTGPAARENAGNGAVAEDTFTPSNQAESTQSTAQAAGIFQLSQAGIVTNAAPAQPGLNPDPNAPPAQVIAPITASNANSDAPAGTANVNAAAATTQTIAGASTAPLSTLTGAVGNAEQAQEHALNTELAALGLSNYDILQIDRIAAALQNFNPSAYTDLVNQFERQAQESKQLTTPPAPPDIGAAANHPTATNSGTGAAANADGTGQQGPGANNTPLGPQIQTPQQSSDTVTANQQNPRPQNAGA